MFSALFKLVKDFTEDIKNDPKATIIRCINKIGVDFRKFFHENRSNTEQDVTAEKRDGSVDKKSQETTPVSEVVQNTVSTREENQLKEKKPKKKTEPDAEEIASR